MKISDLIDKLQEIKDERGDLEVGVTDHYGKFVEMHASDYSVKWDITRGWENRKAQWVQISVPDIGPDPD